MMKKHFVLCALLCSVGLIFGDSKNYYLVDGLHEDNGVIKIWYTALGLLDEYDKGLNAGFEILFDGDGKHFSEERGANWWEYYFAFSTIGVPENSIVCRLPRYKRSTIRFKTVCAMPVERGHYLLSKYMHIQPALQKRLEQIKCQYWPDDEVSVVGVYYQNPMMSEVQKEWSPVELCNRVKQEIKDTKDCKILLFTERDDFVKSFNDHFGSRCVHISYDQQNDEATPADRGERELLTLLLLAQCDQVVAPGSYQSIGAKMLNPSLQLTELDTIPYARK